MAYMNKSEEKSEKIMRDVLGLSLKNDMQEKEIERLRTSLSLLQEKVSSMPTRFEYWSGLMAALGLVIAVIALAVK